MIHLSKPANVITAAAFYCCIATSLATKASATENNGPEPSRIAAIDTIQPDRQFAHVVGDVLLQKLRFPSDVGVPDLSILSQKGRVGEWLERQSAQLLPGEHDEQWLVLRYQIINAPEQLLRAYLPELEISIKANSDTTGSADVTNMILDAWPFTLGPLTINPNLITDADQAQTPVDLRFSNALIADHSLPALDTATTANRALWAVKILLASLFLWGLWWLWREHSDKTRLPFAEAYHRIRRLQSSANHQEQAWKLLHNAFNQQAGKTVNQNDVGQLIEQHTWLNPLQTNIQAFFDASAAQFFELPAKPNHFAIADLAKSLYLSEKKASA